MIYDVAIIGAGVTGALTARELSKYKLKTVVLEAANDMAMGASKANSGIVHAGFDAKPGTLKAAFNVRGCAMMPETCRDLAVPYKNNGSLVVAFSEAEKETLRALYERGLANGVPDMELLDREALLALEPNLSQEAVGALHAKSAGIVCPYELTIAAIENAVQNGVGFQRNFRVISIHRRDGVFFIRAAGSKTLEARCIVNAAGVNADRIARMIDDDSVRIVVRSGEYFILDKAVGGTVKNTIFQCPTEMGKGILVSPTVDGNLLIGPTAMDLDEDDRDNTATTPEGLAVVKELSSKSCPSVSVRSAITSFAGLRAHPVSDDFILGPSRVDPMFIHASGIESPGLTASPAIGEYLAGEVVKALGGAEKNGSFNGVRPAPFMFRSASDEERAAAIARDPAYGRIVCRCESVTEGEIRDAIRAPAGARDVDGVKRRTRAGMGRCQGGFCGSKVVEILAEELDLPMTEITKFGGDSRILSRETK